MAERRMFSKTIIDSDAFLDMPMSSQALYFHLAMRADDDGFINNPKRVMRTVGANQNDLDVLAGKRYILGFESGVIVIKHWKIHNYIQKDRYKPTLYIEEKEMITTKDNKSYTDMDTKCIQDVRLGKDSIGKTSIGKESGGKRFKPPTLEEVSEYCKEKGVDAQKWHDHYTANGWMVGRNKMKDWKAAVRTWTKNEFNTSKPVDSAVPKQDYHTRATSRGVCLSCGKHANLRYGKCEDCE